MKKFHCAQCSTQIFFHNVVCETCHWDLGFAPEACEMLTLRAQGDRLADARNPARRYRRCTNFEGGCNWLIDDQSTETYCAACRHNRTIPDLATPGNLERWRAFEAAKRQLFYALHAFDLPLASRAEDPKHGLIFDCIDDVTLPNGDAKRAMTGHDDGVITIALAEADSIKREQARLHLGETYRTLLGHLRHEIGHYYWDVLVDGQAETLERFRALFGDESEDYAAALKASL